MSRISNKRAGDVGTYLSEHSRRIAQLEQQVSAASVLGSATPEYFDDIKIGNPGDHVVIDLIISPVTNVVASPAAFFNDSYVDVTWTAPVDNSAFYYEVWLYKQKPDLSFGLEAMETSWDTQVRFHGLASNARYGVVVWAINRVGRRERTPATGQVEFDAARDTTPPVSVTGFSISAGFKTIVASWDDNLEEDVNMGEGWYDVQVDTVNTFDSQVGQPLISERVSATVVAFGNVAVNTTYYGRVRAIDSSGNEGPWSAIASTTTVAITTTEISDNAISTPKLQAGSVTADTIAAATITGAKIAAGSITAADAVFASAAIKNADIESLTANKLTAGVIDASIITVTNINADNITAGTITGRNINGGVITGATFRTASAGARVQIGNGDYKVNYYDNNGILRGSLGMFSSVSNRLEFRADGMDIRPLSTTSWNDSNYQFYQARTDFLGAVVCSAGLYVAPGGAGSNAYEALHANNYSSYAAWTQHAHSGGGYNGSSNIYPNYTGRSDGQAGWRPGPDTNFLYCNDRDTSVPNARRHIAVGDVYAQGVKLGSDERIKTDISDPSESLLELVRTLRPRQFRLRGEMMERPGPLPELSKSKVRHGFIAQEMPEELTDKLYIGEDSDELAYDLSSLVSVLTGAIQELDRRVSELEPA